jgi:prolyl-tRNA synthetase
MPREGARKAIPKLLGELQRGYMKQARDRLRARTTKKVKNAEQFREWFSGEGAEDGGFVRAPWSEDPATEELMGELGVTVRCIPFEDEPEPI